MSDNGASAEGGTHGLVSEITYFNGQAETLDDMIGRLDEWGGPTTYPHYAAGWAYAGSTPQKWYKSFVHEGGTRDPLIVSWPKRITDAGGVRDQFHHVVDIAATVYDLTGVERPAVVDGTTQRPLEGTSLAYSLEHPDEPTRKDRQYFEMFAHRAIWCDGWKAVTMHPARGAAARIGDPDLEIRMGRFDEDVWELYHLADDFSEAHDLAASHPEKLAELQEMWWDDARRFNVLPLDDRVIERSQEPRPRLVKPRDVYRFTSPLRLVRSVSPSVMNRDHHIRAVIDVPADDCNGVLVSNGGLQGGYSLFLHEGHLVYVSNYLGREHTEIRSPEPLPAGRVEVVIEWRRTEPFAGDVTMFVDGALVADGHVERTNPVIYAIAEGLEIGSDSGTPVWPGYESPFHFTGGLVEVVLGTVGADHVDAEAEDRIARYVQ
jgi:arylsulfatase